MKGHLQFLKQEFECYFPDLSDTELPELKMTGNLFHLNKDILYKDFEREIFGNEISKKILKAKNKFEAVSDNLQKNCYAC